MELIKDSRLTPTMKRTRNGSIQMFREPNKDNEFITEKNADVILEHEQHKEMYAELIDGKWYWMSSCAECNGKPRTWMSYIECDKHNICASCGAKRKDVDRAWGRSTGWVCNSCKEAEDEERRKEAFVRLDGEEPDCSYMDEIICPHCGSLIIRDDITSNEDIECYVCHGNLLVEIDWTPSYTTSVIGDRITE